MAVTATGSSPTLPLITPPAAGAAAPAAASTHAATAGAAGAATAGTAGAGAAAAGGSDPVLSSDASDRFLKLLVAQMRNQDPLNPMDNAQVTSQMAQISTVQGIERLNESMQKWLTQSGAVQQLDGAGLIGRRVLVEGNGIELTGGTGRTGGARAGFALDSDAEQVRIEVLDATGNAVSTTTRRNVPAGTHTFDWDGRDANGRAQPDGRFTLRVSAGSPNELKPATALTAASVAAVVSSSGGARVELAGGAQRAVSDVRAIL